MSSMRIKTSSFNAGATHCRTSNGRCCAISACAAQPHWALIWNAAIDAAMRLSHTTRAGTGTVPSVSLQRAIAGYSSRLPACCRCPMSMRSSPYPNNCGHLALRNQRLFYSMLFRAASETLLEIAADPRHLGARIGILAVLHTWSQNLQFHPHLHCLIPAGGLAPITPSWIATKRHGFFLPVRVLSRMFRGKLLSFLKQSYRRGELCFAGKLAALSTPRAFYSLLGSLRRREWVVYSKPPFGGPEHVLKYLARYTHRVAISNGRLISLENGQVRFRWRDSRHNNRSSTMRLEATEFIRRFLLHVLPSRLREDSALRTSCQPEPPPGAGPVPDHLHATAADLSSLLNEQPTVCTEPILPTVSMRNPPRHRASFRRAEDQCACSDSLRHSRLLLRKPCSPSFLPTRRLHGFSTSPRRSVPQTSAADLDRPIRFHNQSPVLMADHPTVIDTLPSSRDPPSSIPAKSIQSPYIHRASGLAQIAVSTPLRLKLSSKREISACGALSIRH